MSWASGELDDQLFRTIFNGSHRSKKFIRNLAFYYPGVRLQQLVTHDSELVRNLRTLQGRRVSLYSTWLFPLLDEN